MGKIPWALEVTGGAAEGGVDDSTEVAVTVAVVGSATADLTEAVAPAELAVDGVLEDHGVALGLVKTGKMGNMPRLELEVTAAVVEAVAVAGGEATLT